MKTQLKHFHDRLAKLGIEVKMFTNYPWIYLHSVNGKVVSEIRDSEHGFTIGFLPIKIDQSFKFLDLRKTFKLIRKYC